MTRQTPRVSVFIPAYNADAYLDQAIDSVLEQTYQDFELIVINDGSTDRTPEILDRYHDHPKVTIHTHDVNLGMAPTWNEGVKLGHGEFIVKLDADDYLEPHYLETVVDYYDKHPELGLVFCGVNLIYPDGRNEPEMASLRSWTHAPREFLPSLLQLCVIRSPGVCVRRSCYEQVGTFVPEMKIHADWEMWVRLTANFHVGFIANRLANYRMSYGSNVTSQAAFDGRSMHDLKLWFELLEQNSLPYTLTPEEESTFRWGVYQLEMHFAGMAAYHNLPQMQAAYTQFAEQILPQDAPFNELDRMRQVYTKLHQGICAFRDQELKAARDCFIEAIRTGPQYCRPLWIWNKLLLTMVGRTKWGILYK